MGKTIGRKRKSPSSSNKSKSNKKKTNQNQSVLSQLSTLRELLHGSSYEEIDLSNCLRQCRYNVELAAEQLITGQYISSGSKDRSSNPDKYFIATSTSSSGKYSNDSEPTSENISRQSQSVKRSALNTEESSLCANSISMSDATRPPSHTSSTSKVKSSPTVKRRGTDNEHNISKSSSSSRSYGSISAKKVTKSNGFGSKSAKVESENSNGLLLCQRWIVGFSTSRRGSIKYHESVTLSTSIIPPSSSRKGANIVRFRSDNVEGTLDSNLGSMLAPLMRTTHGKQNQDEEDGNNKSSKTNSTGPLIRVVARGLMEDPLLKIGMEVPLELMVYILRPIQFFALFQDMRSTRSDLFFKGAKVGVSRLSSSLSASAFELLQWAQYGNAPTFECEHEKSNSPPEPSNSDVTSISSFNGSTGDENEEEDQHQDDDLANEGELEVNAPSWVGDVYAQPDGDLNINSSATIPEECDPPSMNKKGVILKTYQRQALHWMIGREAHQNGKNNKKFRDQLELLSELAVDNRSSKTLESPKFDSSNPDCVNGIQCSVGPVLVEESVAANISTLDGAKDPAIHPLWQRRFLWDKNKDTDVGVVFSFYVNELLQIASMKAPNPPKECCGGILADAMGLGKTVMLIALISKDCEMRRTDDLLVEDETQSSPPKPSYSSEPICLDSDDDELAEKKLGSKKLDRQGSGSALYTTLVVAPLSLLAQWEEEITSKSTLSCLAYYGDQAHKPSKSQLAGVDVLITTYGTILSEYSQKSNKGGLLFSIQFHRVILDEAHAIKNPKTGASKACCAINADKRWCVTGTPISNSLQDVYGLLKFLKHEPWCESSFWKKAIQSVKPSDDGDGQTLSMSLGRVRRVLEPMLLRRTKDTLAADGEPILKLPPVDSQVIPVVLSENERLFYNALLTKSQDVFDGFVKAGTASKSWFAIFSLLQRLRQACDHLSLTVKSRLDDDLRDRSIHEEGGTSKNTRCRADEDLSPNDKVRTSNIYDELFCDYRVRSHICNYPKFITDLLDSHKSENSDEYSQKVVDTLTQCIEEDGCLEDECAICLEIPKKNDLAVTPCRHIFCRSCLLATWRGVCPLCSEEISKDNLICSQIGETESPTSKYNQGPDPDKILDFKGILNLAIQGNCSSKMSSVFHEMDKIWSEDPESKILIFSQYLGMLDLIQFHMEKRRIGNFRLDGSMSHVVRRKTLDSFNSYNEGSTIHSTENSNNIRRGCVLLASMKACGVGMNLTVASSVFIIDPWWSFALEKQCINRIHRIGQTADVVRVRKFVVSDSVEEKIVKMQERKMGMASEVLCDKPSGIDGSSNPSLEDLKAIFGR